MKRKGGFFRFLLIVIDIALAVWIFTSYKKAKTEENKPVTPSSSITMEATTKAPKTQAPTEKATRDPIIPPGDEVTEASIKASLPEEAKAFSWYLDDVMTNGVPDGAAQVTEIWQLYGEWSVLLYYDPENEAGEERMVFAHALADAGQSGPLLDLTKDRKYVPASGKTSKFKENSQRLPLELEQSTAVITTDSTYVYLYVYESKGKTCASGVCQTSDGLMLLIAAEKQ